jgi:hypothetical protein
MRIPATAMTNHLTWTRSGVIWATWRLQGLANPLGASEMKKLVLAHHQALFQSLRGEALLLGLCAELDPVSIVERMLDGVDITRCPEWAKEVEGTLDELEEIPLGTRAFWLTVPLAAGSWKTRALSTLRAAITRIRDLLALPRVMPSASEVADAMAAAQRIENVIPKAFAPTRSTPAELVWMALHAQQRGLAADAATPLPPAEDAGPDPFAQEELPGFRMPSELPEPWLDEGGQSDFEDKPVQRVLPFRRRYLKVQSPYSEVPSYQVIQALAAGPKAGWRVPGVEWISRIDRYNIDADWAVRMTVSTADAVKRRNKRAEESIKEQFGQQAGTSSITGGNAELTEVAETLAAYAESMNRSDKEVEVQATTMIAVGAETAELAMAKARFIAADYKGSDFILDAPLGGQEDLWWGMQPGMPTNGTVRDYTQITTGREFASGVPVVLTELGDDRGIRFGRNITNGRHTPCLWDLEGTILADSSASFGIVAELGAGKTTTMIGIIGDLVDIGGRALIIDRTEAREYAKFIKTIKGRKTAIVDLLEPEYSLDPLRVFGSAVGARMVQSLFAVMLGIAPREPKGLALARVLAPDYMTEHGITTLGKLLDHVKGLPETEANLELAGLMSLISENQFGAVLFDGSLPPLDLESQAIAFLTHGIELPSESDLSQQHLFREMGIEKIFGRGMYTLLTAIGRHVCFMDRTQLAGFFVDEAHHITTNEAQMSHVKDFVRDGRKHKALIGMASHDPLDFGDEIIRGLIKIRLIMRQTDETLAARALEWIGLEPSKGNIDIITKELSPAGPDGVPPERRGEGVLRDVRGRIGRVQKTLSTRPDRRAAQLSTPSRNVGQTAGTPS